MTARLGIGFVGAGMATQAIHLPTVSMLQDRFRVVHVADPDLSLATRVATRFNARASTGIEPLLDDPAVEIVAICSPDRFHAEHVVAACRAEKRAVLCEKPLAITREEARRIQAAATESGVPVVVGTMHAFDPAFALARQAWRETGERPSLIRSVAYLPSVDQHVAWATEHLASSYVSFEPHEEGLSQDELRQLMRTVVLDLAIHNTPLVRELMPEVGDVDFARPRLPFGYVISLSQGDQLVQLLALMWGRWRPEWTFDAWGSRHALHAAFPPPYVLAGSATAELVSSSHRTAWSSAKSSYECEWEHVADVAAGTAPTVSPEQMVADLDYALAIADGADRRMAAAS